MPDLTESETIREYPNLTPFSRLDPERSVSCGRKGGIASGEARRRRRSFKDAYTAYLDAEITRQHPDFAKMVAMLRATGFLGPDEIPTNRDLIVFGMGQRARKDPCAFVAIRDTVGEKPPDEVVLPVNAPPIIIGVHDQAFVEKERQRQAELRRQLGLVASGVSTEPIDVELDEDEALQTADTSADAPIPSAPPSDTTSAPATTPPPETPKSAPVSPPEPKSSPAPVQTPLKPQTAVSEPVAIGNAVKLPPPPGKHPSGRYVCIPAAFPRKR